MVNKPETEQGSTPLCTASGKGHVESVKLLLGVEGINVNQSDIQGGTPLFMATQMNHIEIVNSKYDGSNFDEDKQGSGGGKAERVLGNDRDIYDVDVTKLPAWTKEFGQGK